VRCLTGKHALHLPVAIGGADRRDEIMLLVRGELVDDGRMVWRVCRVLAPGRQY
jgi:hypothetical protein